MMTFQELITQILTTDNYACLRACLNDEQVKTLTNKLIMATRTYTDGNHDKAIKYFMSFADEFNQLEMSGILETCNKSNIEVIKSLIADCMMTYQRNK